MTIGTLSARLLLDASGVQSGLGLSRRELNLTRQAFLDSATDAQKLESALNTLASAKDKGAFRDDGQYQAALAAIRAELDPAVIAQNALNAAVAAATTGLQAQIATAGMSADAIARKRLADQGATQAQLDEVAALQATNAALQQQAQTAAAVDQVTTQLSQQAATAGMTADQVQLWKLESQGATKAQLDEVAALQRTNAGLQQQAADAKRGADITRAAVTPAEAYRAKVDELDRLLKAGHISQETYTRSMRGMRIEALQTVPALGTLVGSLRQIPGVGGMIEGAMSAGPAGAAVAGAVAVAGAAAYGVKQFVSEIQQQMAIVDDIADKAEALGMRGTELMGLHEIAIATETDAGAVETAVYKMQVKIGEAASGSKPALEAFQNLGVSWKELAGLAPDKAFEKVAGSISKLPTQSDRAAASQDMFGKGARELGRILNKTEADLAAMVTAGADMGRMLTEDQIGRVSAADDAWRELGMSWEGLARQSAPELADASAAVARGLKELMDNAEVREGVLNSVSALAKGIGKVGEAIGGLSTTWSSLPGPVKSFFNPVGSVLSALGEAGKSDAESSPLIKQKEEELRAEKRLADAQKAMQRETAPDRDKAQKELARERDQLLKSTFDPFKDFSAKQKAAQESLIGGGTEDEKKLAASIKSVSESLMQQANTWGMSADDAQIASLRMQNATEADIAYVKLFQDALKDLRIARQESEVQIELDAMRNQTDEVSRQALVQRGITAEQQKQLDMMRLQGAAADEVAAKENQFRQLTKAGQQKEMSDRVRTLRDELASLQMQADPIERRRLQQRGITAEQAVELQRLKEQGYETAGLEEAWRQVKRAKDAAKSTTTTIGAGTIADAYDAMQRAKEAGIGTEAGGAQIGKRERLEAANAAQEAFRGLTPDKLAGLDMTEAGKAAKDAEAAFRSGPVAAYTTAEDPFTIWERIAKGVEALVNKDGVTVEEVSL